MLTEIETETELPPELAAITETVEYPPEVVERWVRESDITWQEYKNGEIKRRLLQFLCKRSFLGVVTFWIASLRSQ